jgi:predicted MFS family arabinose efflux permease
MKSSTRNWSLALLFAAGALNLFDRQIINVLAEDIKREFQISDAALGLLTGTAFGLLYSIAIVPLARVADRTNRVTLIAAALALWSLFTALCGATRTFAQLFLARMGVGVGEAGCQPASVSLVADLFPESRRTSATAILLVGAPVGACLGLLLGGALATNFGWRTALFIASVPGFVVAALMVLTVRDPMSRTTKASDEGTFAAALSALAATRSLRWLTLAFACETFGLFATGAWLPVFFIRAHGLSAADAGLALGLAVGIGGAFGALALGYLCDLLRPRNNAADWQLPMLVLALNVPLAALVVLAPALWIAVAAAFALNVTIYAYLGPVPVLIQRQASFASRSLALGGVTAIANILSMCLGVPLVGLLSDLLGPQAGPHAIGYAFAACLSAASAIGIFALARARGAESADNARSTSSSDPSIKNLGGEQCLE